MIPPAPRDEPPALARALALLPHPEGGWYRETWRTATGCAPDGYPGPRACASGIYYLLGPGEESAHTVRSDEMWLWHRGGPLELLLAGDGPTPGPSPERLVLGADVETGQHPQVLVPAGVWQSARPLTGEGALVSCVVAPGFAFEDFHLLDDSGPERSTPSGRE